LKTAKFAVFSRTMRRSSGRQEPQLVPHFSVFCNSSSRASAKPLLQLSSVDMISVSETLKQLHT
jgi:hypothetical protein